MPTNLTRSRVLGLALVLCLAGPVPGTNAARSDMGAVPLGGAVADQVTDPDPAACAPRPIARTWTRTMLTAVTRAGDRAWAVGMTASGPEAPRSPIALALQGGTWTRMSIASRPGEHALFGMDRSSSGRMWSVGYRQTSAGYRPLLLSWQAGRWRPWSLGPVGSRAGALVDVRARTDAATFAVGYTVGRHGQRPLVVRRTSRGWRVSRLPISAATTGALLSIDVRSAHDALAVGWRTIGGSPRPWAVRWDGRAWRTVSPVRSGSEGVLTSVAVADAGVAWAAGYRISAGRYRPMVQRWDGRVWRDVAFPAGGRAVGVLRSIQVRADGEPAVAGTRWDADGARWQGFVGWRTGTRWQLDDMPGSGSTDLHSLALGPDGSAWAVGGRGTRSLIATACAGAASTATASLLGTVLRAPDPDAAVVDPSADPEPSRSPGPEPAIPQPTETPERTPAPVRAKPAPRTSGADTRAAATRPRIRARDVTRAAGLTGSIHSYGAVRADFDRDRWPDLFIGRHSEPGWLLLNERGRFRRAPAVAFPGHDRHGCAAADVDDDGRIDLYCAIGANKGVALKGNELWMAQRGGGYEDQASELLASDPIGRGRLAAFFDLDHDRYPDLFLADRPDRPDGLPSRHRVLANPGGDGFQARSTAGFDAGTGADCVATGDLDRDGWEDVVLCARGYRPSGWGIRILRNVRGKLIDVTAVSRMPRAKTLDATLADLNGDGRPDIIEVTRTRLRVHLRRGSRYVLAYSRRLVDGAAVAAGDADGDGDKDIYVAQGSPSTQRPDMLLLNRGHGRRFRHMAMPRVSGGAAESVTAIDHDRNGLMDFLVLNGARSSHVGPVQLIAMYRR
ncbi:MAG: FG-GAP-like repeat-containing protein [Candidatus Limnocylindrales bacterium]